MLSRPFQSHLNYGFTHSKKVLIYYKKGTDEIPVSRISTGANIWKVPEPKKYIGVEGIKIMVCIFSSYLAFGYILGPI